MVKGVLKFDKADAVPPGQKVRISLQDTARAGADATEVAQTHVTIPEDFDAATDDLPFEIDVAAPVEGLTIRAHMPRHDGTDVRVGDMITTASIPVTDGDEKVSVTLRRV